MPHILSTLSSDVAYTGYIAKSENEGGPNIPNRSVKVKGGHGVANRQHALANGVLTPDGVATKVSDEDLAFLEQNPLFLTHQKNGHVKILRTSPASIANVAKNMATTESSRPLTDTDFQKGGRAAMPANTPDSPWGIKTSTIQ